MEVAVRSGYLSSDVRQQLTLLDEDIEQLAAAPIFNTVLSVKHRELLNGSLADIVRKVDGAIEGQDYRQALVALGALEQSVIEITSEISRKSSILQREAAAGLTASRGWFILATALALSGVCYLAVHQRGVIRRRLDHHVRSFATLYQHMTGTRVSALRMFLDMQDHRQRPSRDMLNAARAAANELEAINIGLRNISAGHGDLHTEPLEKVLASALEEQGEGIPLQLSAEVLEQPVPAIQFEFLFRELIKNSRSAIANRPNGSIVICGRIAKALLLGGPRLEMEIIDNGIGMTEEVSRKAATTFFSTKAGTHLGLGLSICSQMISNLKGTLQIESRAGTGTTVRFSVPVAMLRNRKLSPDAADRELTAR